MANWLDKYSSEKEEAATGTNWLEKYADLRSDTEGTAESDMSDTETITPQRSADERAGLLEKVYRPLAGGFVGSLGAMTSGAGFGVKWLADNNQIISDEEAARLAALTHGEKATPDDLTFHRRSPVADVLLQEGQRTRELGSEIGWVSNPNLVSETAGALGSMAAYYIPALLMAPAAGAAAASGRFLTTPLGAKAADMAARGAAWLVHSGTEALSNAGSTYDDLVADGVEDSKAMTAAKRDFFTNYLIKLATEPVGALGGRLGGIPGIKGRMARGLAEALSEGFVEEPSQNLSSNAAKKSLNETYGGFLKNLLGEYRDNYVNEVMNVGAPSAIAGGIMGAILPGDVQALGKIGMNADGRVEVKDAKSKQHKLHVDEDVDRYVGMIEDGKPAATQEGLEGANMGADDTDTPSRKFVPDTRLLGKGVTLTDGAGKSRNVPMGTMAKSELVRLSPEHSGNVHYSLSPSYYARSPLYGVRGEEVGARFAAAREEADAKRGRSPHENTAGSGLPREEGASLASPEPVVDGAAANEAAADVRDINDGPAAGPDVQGGSAARQDGGEGGTELKEYKYYMNARPAGPGAIPKGSARIDAADRGGRYGAVYYDRELQSKEVSDYELAPAKGAGGAGAAEGGTVERRSEFEVVKKSPSKRISEKQRTAAAKRVQERGSGKSNMQGYYIDEEGRQVFTDMGAIFRLSKHVAGLEAADANVTWPAKVARLFDGVRNDGEEVTLGREDIAEMIERGRRFKGKDIDTSALSKGTYITKVGSSYVSSERLGEVLSILGSDEVSVHTSKPKQTEHGEDSYLSNVYFTSENGEALLAPVYTDAKSRAAVDSYFDRNGSAGNSAETGKGGASLRKEPSEGPRPSTGEDGMPPVISASGRDGAAQKETEDGTEKLDREYLAAVEAGDMVSAQRMVDETAAAKGYATEVGYRSKHKAPHRDGDGYNANIIDLAKGHGIVPADMWTRPRDYGIGIEEHSEESFGVIRKAVEAARRFVDGKRRGEPEVSVYRAVSSGVKEGSPRNADWVSPSRAYAERHGETVLNGAYRIQKLKAKASELYWNGDSINEWGFDDGKNYAYRNTKNNRKLFDAVVRDEAGEVVPLSKRFDASKKETHYRLGPTAQAKLDADTAAFAKQVDDFVAGKMGRYAEFNVMQTPLVLQISDERVKPLPVVMPQSVLRKIFEKHNLTPNMVKQLPKALADPIMVLASEGKPGQVSDGFVVMLELKDANGGTVNVPVALNSKQGRGHECNVVTSMYGRTDERTGLPANRWFVEQAQKPGLLKYINTKKFSRWVNQTRLVVPERKTSGKTIEKIPAGGESVNTKKFSRWVDDAGLALPGRGYNSGRLNKILGQNGTVVNDKASKWAHDAGLDVPGRELIKKLDPSVRTEADLVKAQDANPGAYALGEKQTGLPPLSVADVAARVKGAEVSDLGRGKMKLEFSNGTAWIVDTQAEAIAVDPEVVKRDYGRDAEPDDVVSGRTRVIDGQRFIDLVAGMSDASTFSHEVFESAWDSLSKEEQAAVLKTHGSRERAAEMYGEFLEGRVGKLTKRTQAIFQRLKDFFSAIRATLFGRNSEDVFRDIASGKALNRPAAAGEVSAPYGAAHSGPVSERSDMGAGPGKTSERSDAAVDGDGAESLGRPIPKAEVDSFVSGLTPSGANVKTVDPQLAAKIRKMPNGEALAFSVNEVKRLQNSEIVTPLGERVYFAPGNTEDVESYTLHIIAGMEKPLSEVRSARVMGLFTAEETLKDPLAILRQENGRTFYVSLYDTKSGNMMNGVIVGVEEGQNGRVVTSIIQLDKSSSGNKAMRELKKHIQNAKDVLYLWKGQSGHPRPPTDQHGSLPDVGLPMSGKDNVAQNAVSDNTGEAAVRGYEEHYRLEDRREDGDGRTEVQIADMTEADSVSGETARNIRRPKEQFSAAEQERELSGNEQWQRDIKGSSLERVVSTRGKKRSLWERMKPHEGWFVEFSTDWRDDLYPLLAQFGDKFHMKATNELHGVYSRALYRIQYGAKDKGVKALQAILKMVPEGEHNGFSTYAVLKHLRDVAGMTEEAAWRINELRDGMKRKDITKAERRSMELEAASLEEQTKKTRGRASGYEAAVRKIEKHYPHWMEAQAELVKYNKALLEMMSEEGIISRELFDELEKRYPNYVPLQRDFGDEDTLSAFVSSRGMVNVSAPIKRLRGSQRDVIDPFEQILRNTFQFESVAARQRLAKELVKGYDEGQYKDIFEEQFSAGELKRQAKALYAKAGGVNDTAEKARMKDEAKRLMGRAAHAESLSAHSPTESVFYVYENGRKRHFKTDNDIYQALTLSGSRFAENDIVKKLATFPAKTLRAGTTHGLTFAIRNMIRDTVSYAVLGEEFRPFIDTALGMTEAITNNKGLYEDFMKHGGLQGMTNVSADRMADLLHELKRDKRNLLLDAVKLNGDNTVWKLLGDISELSETASRLGQYKRLIEAKNADGSLKYTKDEAVYMTRDNMNFMRAGRVARRVNQYVAFFNAGIQGVDKMLRTFYKGGKVNKKALLRAGLYITLPSMLQHFYNYSDDERKKKYQNLPAWRKNLFWNLIVGDTTVTIPKPFELGVIFGSLPERMVDRWLASDEAAFEGFTGALFSAMTPEMAPNLMLLAFELGSGYSKFYDRQIVPQREQRLEREYQYGPYTSEMAKGVSKAARFLPDFEGVPLLERGMDVIKSPRLLEYAYSQMTGGAGKEFSNLVDSGVRALRGETRPSKPWWQTMPGFRGLFADASVGGRDQELFQKELYDKKHGLLTKLNSAVEKLETEGPASLSEAQIRLLEMEQAIKYTAKLNTDKNGIYAAYRDIRAITLDKQMTADEKAAAIKDIELDIRDASQQGLEEVREIYRFLKGE